MWLIIVLSQYSFSTLLIWREVMVLEGAYVTNQRNNLENVAHEMDSLLLFNIDRMVFFRNGMQSALETPLDFEILRNAEQEYMSKRHEPIWSVALHNRRTLPVYGVSDDFVDSQRLSRHDALTGNELMAVLELGYLLRLVDENRGLTKGCCTFRAAVFLPAPHCQKRGTGPGALHPCDRRAVVYPAIAAEQSRSRRALANRFR
jgi:hypothetical protein